jgi:hypothetical protein
MRIHDPYAKPELALSQLDGLLQVRVVGNDHSGSAVLAAAVEEKVRGEVDIRALLLCLDHRYRGRTSWPRPARGILIAWER